MIVMINGAFGVGKTSAAAGVLKKFNDSLLFDPEEVGVMLRNVLPENIKTQESANGDFQDFLLWKESVIIMAQLLHRTYRKNLIVPMTICKPEYFKEIKSGFEAIDADTFHFCLAASQETVHRRLSERGETEGDWCFLQTGRCLQAYADYDFGEYLCTEDKTADEVIEELTERIKLKINKKGQS